MCGRVRLSSDVSEIKLVFSIPPKSANPVVRYDVMRRVKATSFGANIGAHRSGKVVKLFTGNMSKKGYGSKQGPAANRLREICHHLAVKVHKSIC